ncbi:DsrE family protein [Thermocrinis sp.]|uniref:DsrE family protein n=1 Tax=Thermocrinis sp. TaxID=2024383 RepID=UPI002FDD9C3D
MLKVFLSFLIFFTFAFATEEAKFVQTEYKKPFRVVYELFLDHPEKLRPALGWISNVIFVLTHPPYNFNLEDIDIVVVSHGRELEVFAKEHKDKYQDIVERLESLSQYGVKFKLCRIALTQLYGYSEKDLYPFVETVPSAITEIAYWQQMGYSLLIPMVFEIRR